MATGEQISLIDYNDKDGATKLPPLNNYQAKRNSWVHRTFGPMKQGSLRGSVFILTSTAMGAGYLAIPLCLLQAGLILGLAIVILCAFLMYYSLKTVSNCAKKYNIYHYPTVCKEMLGVKWAVLLDTAIILNGIGLIIALNIIVGEIVPSIFKSLNMNFDRALERDLIMLFLNVLIVTPLGLMRKLTTLRFKALFNVICLTFVMLVVIIEFPFFVKHNNFSKINYFVVDINIFSAFSIGMFAYLCHQNIARIQGELFNRTEPRMKKVTRNSIYIMSSLFCILALFGYLSCLNDTPNLIIMRKAPDSIGNDWAMVIARFLISFTLTIAIPINLLPCRTSIEKLIFKVDGTSSLIMHLSITLTTIMGCMLIAMFYPNITVVFNFLGGFCAGVMGLIIPGLMYIKLSEQPLTTPRNLIVLIASWTLAIIGFTSVIIDIVQEAS
ncbi:unnamed protein product [Blepharisma stoltei]|uniref:Amino acid transporter transmembrane domain-containing protein n=1 Tax=Blepharisma stoltei TaxID=1481888 RepID=A0AAU9KNA3_9CILI|nr:unnamed protein product [Blepharisma stoltei]